MKKENDKEDRDKEEQDRELFAIKQVEFRNSELQPPNPPPPDLNVSAEKKRWRWRQRQQLRTDWEDGCLTCGEVSVLGLSQTPFHLEQCSLEPL